MRLAKYLSSRGVASRRAAERLIRAGRVSIDGATVTDPARSVSGSEEIAVDRAPVPRQQSPVVYALNKPAGVVSTASDPQGRPTVVDLVDSPVRLYPVGRLDIDTTGLILVTNDGPLAHRLTHPSFEVPKTYRATVARAPVHEAALGALQAGVELDDGRTAPAQVRRLGPASLELTIHEGRKRQIKRMCEAVGHPVRHLERVAIGGLSLGRLKPGTFRRLSDDEVVALLDDSSGRQQ
ncbi:MAG TPA: pseudouridine synthase [Solirubrobacteraceae bacterium]|jgi:23S rRNA pseudouridine2605 synthase